MKKLLISNGISSCIDDRDKRVGEKYYFWEMKGVPLRIEIGKKETENNELTIFRRDKSTKEKIKEKDLIKYMICSM